MEGGSDLGHDERHTRPADVLIPNWVLGKPAAVDLTVTFSLTSATLIEAIVSAGSTAQRAELRKHNWNDAKCLELCIPLAVEVYGCWEAGGTADQIAWQQAQLSLNRGGLGLCSLSNHCTVFLASF